jgi:hypothetical protein
MKALRRAIHHYNKSHAAFFTARPGFFHTSPDESTLRTSPRRTCPGLVQKIILHESVHATL